MDTTLQNEEKETFGFYTFAHTLGKHHLLKVHNKSSPNPTLALIGAFVSLMKIYSLFFVNIF